MIVCEFFGVLAARGVFRMDSGGIFDYSGFHGMCVLFSVCVERSNWLLDTVQGGTAGRKLHEHIVRSAAWDEQAEKARVCFSYGSIRSPADWLAGVARVRG